jgi:hypothetical protein
VVNNGPIYTSLDSGSSWEVASGPVASWSSVASSADAGLLVASVYGGGIWNRRSIPAPVLNIRSSGNDLALLWVVPSTDFQLQQNTDLTTTNWATLTDFATLNLTNLHKEVILPLNPGSHFYRLVAPQ